jgi:hypothetical protein
VEHLENPITERELYVAIRKGISNKAPGIDGLGIEFYKMNWNTIGSELLELVNFMFIQQKMTPLQKHGIIICLPKLNDPSTPATYRPITLYKLMT